MSGSLALEVKKVLDVSPATRTLPFGKVRIAHHPPGTGELPLLVLCRKGAPSHCYGARKTWTNLAHSESRYFNNSGLSLQWVRVFVELSFSRSALNRSGINDKKCSALVSTEEPK